MITFMGATLHNYPKAIIVSKIVDFLHQDEIKLVTTPNPEMILQAQKNPKLKEILGNADIGICDGVGLLWILKLKGVYGIEKISGVDFLDEIAKKCHEYNKSIMFVGGGPGVSAEAKLKMQQKYLGLKIDSYIGPNVSYKINQTHPYAQNDQEVINEINAFKPDVLVLALGAGKQEIWLNEHKHKFEGVKIMIGVGGAFDMIAGVTPRAPKIFQKIGLEWLWRVIIQPQRIIRILKAVVVFPIIALRHKVYFPDGTPYE